MTFGAGEASPMASVDTVKADMRLADIVLEGKARRLLAITRQRDGHFRRAVMDDSIMSVMLSLLLAELAAIPLTQANLALTNILDGAEAERVVDNLIHAGLVAITGVNPERRTVGLTPFGSARMRSYISDYPDI